MIKQINLICLVSPLICVLSNTCILAEGATGKGIKSGEYDAQGSSNKSSFLPDREKVAGVGLRGKTIRMTQPGRVIGKSGLVTSTIRCDITPLSLKFLVPDYRYNYKSIELTGEEYSLEAVRLGDPLLPSRLV